MYLALVGKWEKLRLAGTRGAGIMETKWDISDSLQMVGGMTTTGLALSQFIFVSDLALHDRLGKFLWNAQTWSSFLIQFFSQKISFYIWAAFVL
jgi:hypothetical protein